MFNRKKYNQEIMNKTLLDMENFCSDIEDLIEYIENNIKDIIKISPSNSENQNPVKELDECLIQIDTLISQNKHLISILNMNQDKGIRNKIDEIIEKRKRFSDFQNSLELMILEYIKYVSTKETASSSTLLLDIIKSSSITSKDYEAIVNISFKDFVSQLSEISMEKKKIAYTGLLTNYLHDLRAGRFLLDKLSKEAADDLHNLPLFINRDFKDFDESFFWEPIFKGITKGYLISVFVKRLTI